MDRKAEDEDADGSSRTLDLLPYPVKHLATPGPKCGGVTYSSPTLAAFVDAIAA